MAIGPTFLVEGLKQKLRGVYGRSRPAQMQCAVVRKHWVTLNEMSGWQTESRLNLCFKPCSSGDSRIFTSKWWRLLNQSLGTDRSCVIFFSQPVADQPFYADLKQPDKLKAWRFLRGQTPSIWGVEWGRSETTTTTKNILLCNFRTILSFTNRPVLNKNIFLAIIWSLEGPVPRPPSNIGSCDCKSRDNV